MFRKILLVCNTLEIGVFMNVDEKHLRVYVFYFFVVSFAFFTIFLFF